MPEKGCGSSADLSRNFLRFSAGCIKQLVAGKIVNKNRKMPCFLDRFECDGLTWQLAFPIMQINYTRQHFYMETDILHLSCACTKCQMETTLRLSDNRLFSQLRRFLLVIIKRAFLRAVFWGSHNKQIGYYFFVFSSR